FSRCSTPLRFTNLSNCPRIFACQSAALRVLSLSSTLPWVASRNSQNKRVSSATAASKSVDKPCRKTEQWRTIGGSAWLSLVIPVRCRSMACSSAISLVLLTTPTPLNNFDLSCDRRVDQTGFVFFECGDLVSFDWY